MSSPTIAPGGKLLALLQLLRLPNVFTAIADVMMGYLVVEGSLRPGNLSGLLIGSSSLLYLAGMVLNDVFDAAVDARERPQRPIPSGRVTLAKATLLGWSLWAAGLAAGWTASLLASDWRPGVIATLLAGCVLLYDGLCKATIAGPLVMGLCRTLNVLLGMSLAAPSTTKDTFVWSSGQWLLAIGIGVYIVGVTHFARGEAERSSRGRLCLGLLVMLAGLGLVAALPWSTSSQPRLLLDERNWYFLWAIFALIIARRAVLAIVEPSPPRVQSAVRQAILSLILIDAAIVLGTCGPFWGCVVLLLFAPAVLLGQWIYST